jgi:hypothetical protein
LPDKVEILCRDIPSYDHVISLYSNKENVYLCDDLAFFYSPPDRGKIHQKVGNLFRIDIEKTGHNIPTDNVDISQTIPQKFPKKSDESIKDYYHRIGNAFIEQVSHYEVVNTNRLHVAIVAAKLGKQVNFSPNSYWKNAAVYDFSMKDKYANVTFHYSNTQPLSRHLNLSEKLIEIVKTETPFKNNVEAKTLIILAKIAWNYAITRNYALLKEVIEDPKNRQAATLLEQLFTVFIERKQVLFPADNNMITQCDIIQTENNQLNITVKSEPFLQ